MEDSNPKITKLQGNKKEISRSKIINNIPTKKNLISNCCLESPYGAKPHSNGDIFSASEFLTANKYDNPISAAEIIDATIMYITIG